MERRTSAFQTMIGFHDYESLIVIVIVMAISISMGFGGAGYNE
jgi:hypothetical protein